MDLLFIYCLSSLAYWHTKTLRTTSLANEKKEKKKCNFYFLYIILLLIMLLFYNVVLHNDYTQATQINYQSAFPFSWWFFFFPFKLLFICEFFVETNEN